MNGRYKYFPEIVVGLCALLCILVAVLIHTDPGFERYSSAATPFFILQPESVTEEAIPDYAGVRRTYTFTVPDAENATTRGASLYLYLRHTIAQYEIEDSSLNNDPISAGTPRIGKTPGNYWLKIPIRPAFAGKTLRITLTPVFDSIRNDEPTFMIITRDMLVSMIEFPEDGLLLVLSLVAFGSGLLIALFSLTLPMNGKDKKRIFYLGAVTMVAGIWKFSGLPIVPLLLEIWGFYRSIWYVGAVSYLLMLVLSLRLLVAIRSETENRTGMVCFYLAAGVALVLLLLQLSNILELHQSLIFYGVGMALIHVISLFGKKPGRSELLWLLPFFLTLGADLLIYFVTGSMRRAPLFLVWIIVNLFVRGVGFVREAILQERLLRKREEELRDAKVQSMINQIRPHFIYNTLVSIYELCRDDPTRAMQVIDDFTTYLQSNFSAIAGKRPISFREELTHTQAYLAVETMLHGDDLSVEFDTEAIAFNLPPLTLQPIVENAVKHGIGMGHRPEHISIRTRALENGVQITVEDNGIGYDPQPDSAVHVGLQNVRERLDMMCGGTLEIEPRPAGGTVVTVFVPG